MGAIANALTDKDFLEMRPEDQKGYLSHIDPDFAKMSSADQGAYHSQVVAPAVRANSAKMNAQPTAFEKAQSENPIDTEAKNPISRTLSSAGGTVLGALSHPLDTAKGALESLGDVATLGLTSGSPIGESVRAWANPKTRPTWEGIKSVLPEAIGQGIGNVALGEATGAIARPVANAVTGTARGIGGIPDATRNWVAEKAMEAPDVAAQKAVGIGAKSPKAIPFQKNLATARPYLKGATSLEDLQAKIPIAKADIWRPYNDAVQMVGNNMVQGPDGPITVTDLEKMRLETSAELQSTRKLNPTNRQDILQKNGAIKELKDRYDRITGALDPQLASTGIDPQLIRNVHGSVKGIERLVEGRNTLAENKPSGFGRMASFDVMHPIRSLGKEVLGGARDIVAGRPLISGSPTDIAVREGFRTGGPRPNLGTPTAPPPPRALLPAPTPVLAPNVDTSGPIRNAPAPMVWTPEMREQVARQTPQAPPNAATMTWAPPGTPGATGGGTVTGIGSIENAQAVGPTGTAGRRFAPKGLIPGPTWGTAVPQAGGHTPVGFPLDLKSPWQGGGLPKAGFESFPTTPIIQAPPERFGLGTPIVPETGTPGGYHVPPLKPSKAGPAAEAQPKLNFNTNPTGLTLEEVRKAKAEGEAQAQPPAKKAEPEAEAPPKAKEPEGVLPGMGEHVAKQKAGAAEVAGEKLTAEANTPKNIEAAAGEMETKSPLFRGKGPQKEIFEPAPVSKPLAEEYTPDEIEEAKLMLQTEVGATQAGEKPGRYFDVSEPGDVRTGSRQIRGGDWRSVRSGRNLYPFLKNYPQYTASMIEKALKSPNAPASQQIIARAAKMVRAEKLAKAGRLREPGEEGPVGPPGPIEGVPF